MLSPKYALNQKISHSRLFVVAYEANVERQVAKTMNMPDVVSRGLVLSSISVLF